jgi:hypothetical protein
LKTRALIWTIAVCFFAALLAAMPCMAQEEQPPAGEVTADPWPRMIDEGGVKYTIYQPQLDSWDGYNFAAHAAVSVLPAGLKEPTFGVIDITATTLVDKVARTVELHDIRIEKALFPSAPNHAQAYRNSLQAILSGGPSTMSLDRLQAALAITGAETQARAVPVRNEPPQFVFAQSPTILVSVDGEPVWRPVKGTSLERVINTRALMLLDDKSGKYYIHLFDGFIEAPSFTGPWTAAKRVPPSAGKLATELAKQRVVDLMEGQPDETTKKKPSLKSGVPAIVVVTQPSELIVTEGAPDWQNIGQTNLLYMNNTTGNVFLDLNNQQMYVLVTGRWFRAPGITGPWQYVPAKDLPPDFANIPDDSPKENVKASVPGTPQAQEAVIANEIPQTATVYRSKAAFTPQVNGAPELKPVADTSLMYVFNSPDPIIMVSATQWYALRSGVWFTAASLQGPWVVATAIPAVIYSIPPSSPLHYVTYVKIYYAAPQYVVVGYTPGYMGTVVTADGVVVYGTGYTYAPYIGATVWYPAPVTYGYSAAMAWTPWTGWAMGFGFGMYMGAAWGYGCCWGCAPYWGAYPYHGYAYGPAGAAAWGPGGWAATTGNVYSHWGATTAVSRSSAGYNAWTGNAWSSKVGTSYNSVTGRVSAGQRASVSNVYTGGYAYGQRGATYNPSTGVGARGGSATYGNANTGAQDTAKWGQVSGPRGQSTGVVQSGNNTYADHNGNVYKDTGSGWQKYDNGSWNDVEKPSTSTAAGSTTRAPASTTDSLDAQKQARAAGDQRSASSSWGSKDWGGGFDHGGSSAASRPSGGGGDRNWAGGGGGDRSWAGGGGGGGWDRGGGGGGWDRGGGGFGGGGDRSWGGGGFGGFRGGGFRR